MSRCTFPGCPVETPRDRCYYHADKPVPVVAGRPRTERPPKWDSWLPESERLPDDAWEAVESANWTTVHPLVGTGHCRWGSPRYGYCGKPPAAVLMRGRNLDRPYGYCAEHLYGRWIEDGRVLDWRVRRDTVAS